MARYTGPSWKQSRRLKFSILETGKELQKRPTGKSVFILDEYLHGYYIHGLSMVFNYKKNKKFVSIMVLMKNNSVTYLKKPQRFLVNKVITSYSY